MEYFYAYTRVSTVKQGTEGVSLKEQKDAIRRYADSKNFTIIRWFSEQVTAAKSGRKVFGEMIQLLQQKQAAGVIIHKIDRGARNLRDWVDIQDLIDQGIQVHFANESIDLASRGGRLYADFQAVVATDFSRNNRDEAKKGIYGRLKEGLYPFPAVLGYLDQGRAKPKIPDPKTAPLVRQAFELYATGDYGVNALLTEMRRRGLRSQGGKKISQTGMLRILHNTFYTGIITLTRKNQTYKGIHEPLISVELYRRVQRILESKTAQRAYKHDFTYRGLVSCSCRKKLIAEKQKRFIYYRCHTLGCPSTSIREDRLEETIWQTFKGLRMPGHEHKLLFERLHDRADAFAGERRRKLESLNLLLKKLVGIEDRLTDAYLEGTIGKGVFDQRKKTLLLERQELEQRIKELEAENDHSLENLHRLLELAKDASLAYKTAPKPEKRYMLKTLTSNRMLCAKNLIIELPNSLQV